ncbi:MoaD/ThiS family protein [Ancylobacter terrae]|uniref:MoaD/ThiS family protein n=1 Tax=Ancylobacter sp. sgz301288 TaxID=3342077 RepID=UPI00385CDBFF
MDGSEAQSRNVRAAAHSRVRVRLPAHLVTLFPGAERLVPVTATTVSEMVEALDRLWPGMGARICDETPAIRRHINVFVEGRRARLSTPLPPGADVFVITAISGG